MSVKTNFQSLAEKLFTKFNDVAVNVVIQKMGDNYNYKTGQQSEVGRYTGRALPVQSVKNDRVDDAQEFDLTVKVKAFELPFTFNIDDCEIYLQRLNADESDAGLFKLEVGIAEVDSANAVLTITAKSSDVIYIAEGNSWQLANGIVLCQDVIDCSEVVICDG